MVSTRGIKSRFTEGELVLCYEPDPAKTKVLYDSKVLDIIVNKDETGKKFLEFLIHFQGWNPTWDRFVTEDYVLKDTAENRQLQKELAEKAQLTTALKLYRGGNLYKRDRKKRTRKLSEKINESLEAKRPLVSPETTQDETSESSEEEEEADCPQPQTLAVAISIPDRLKKYLEYDYYMINQCGRLVKLPSEPNVLTILENYVKDYAINQLNTNEQNESEKSRLGTGVPKSLDYICNSVNLCKEVADGLRVYFDFTLKALLLYGAEKEQESCSNMFENIKQESLNEQQPSVNIKQEAVENDVGSGTNVPLHSEKEASGSTDGSRRKSLRSHRAGGFEFTNGVDKPSPSASEIKEENTHSINSFSSNTSASALPTNNLQRRETLLSQIMEWKIVPPHMKNSLVPSQLYGAVHLARLFVKLPELLPSSMTDEKMDVIMYHFSGLLKYLESHPDWFDESHYEEGDGNAPVSTDEVSN